MAETVGQLAEQSIAFPDPPRELTPVIRRRLWTEPRVRRWWILAAGLALLLLYIIGMQTSAWLTERRLIHHGTVVEAKIISADTPIVGNVTAGRPMPPDSDVDLEFDWTDGRKLRVTGKSLGHIDSKQNVVVGKTVAIHVDPEDPSVWTSRTRPAPLISNQLIALSVGLPLLLILLAFAFLKRKALADVYGGGRIGSAIVVGLGQSPFAPRARAVRCTAADSNDKRVFTVYLPPGDAPAPGESIWIIRPGAQLEPAIALGWVDRG